MSNPALRVGDAEREAVAAQIREAYAAGRLTHEEMSDRLDACMAARTVADLRPLVADLPVVAAPAVPPAPPGGGGQAAAWRRWAAASMIVWVIWAVAAATGGGGQGLWPLWVSGPWAAVLLAHAIRGTDATGSPTRHERDERRNARREQRRSRRR